jgi:3-oxoacyl-[acyl-carrier protein] reductase
MQKRVLVTGASRGIGRGIAKSLAQDGYHVVINFRKGFTEAESLATELVSAGQNCSLLQFDISDRQATREAIESDIESHGAYYGVVCNAGITRDAAFPAITDNDWDSVIHTNLDGFYNVVHPLIMPMIRAKSGGRIVAMSSVSGVVGNRGQVNYSASKAGLIGAAKALAVEVAKRNITVNCVAPGLIDTEMVLDEVANEALKMIPARRMGKIEEVSGLVSYLFSESASYLTRQVISVNGGLA